MLFIIGIITGKLYIVNIKGEAGSPMKEVLDLNIDDYLFKSQKKG